MKKIVITGGAGFIGSHVVDHFVENFPQAKVLVLDKMTYAADIRNIMPLISEKRAALQVGDVCDLDTCVRAVTGADLVIHAAAESHVDNSFDNSLEFTKTNVVGTHCVMEACRREGVPKVIHVSTDEVYGEVFDGHADENAPLRPTTPYSASKAAAEMIVNGYLRSFKMPIVTVRANNIFGTRQFPEKIIPKFALLLLTGKSLTLHGTGQNRRHYLAARDFAAALEMLAAHGEIGRYYNIGTTEEYTNIQMAHMVCHVFGLNPDKTITFIPDRPYNDARYAVDWSEIAAMGWKPQRSLVSEIPALARWYADNFFRYGDPSSMVRRPAVETMDGFSFEPAARAAANG